MAGTSARITAWHWKARKQELESKLRQRLAQVGEMVAGEVRKNISTPTRTEGASEPGAFPHADTGTLRKSVTYELPADRLSVRIGSNVEYAPHLEHGTQRMDERPFLDPTVKTMLSTIRRKLQRPLR